MKTKTTRKKTKTFQKTHGLDVKHRWNFCLEKINMPKKQMKSFFKNYTELINLKNGERKKGHKKLNLQIGRVV